MSDAVIFVGAFAVLLVLRVMAATLVFVLLLPRSDRCPLCDAPTLRMAHPVWNRIAPFFRTSWCPACGWEGMLRHGPASTNPASAPAASVGDPKR